MIGLSVQKVLLEEAVTEHGLDMESGKIDFITFCHISTRFMTEEDEEGLREELKEAFRIYDRDGEGFITTDVLKEILREIDSELTEDDLDNIIEEVDEDGGRSKGGANNHLYNLSDLTRGWEEIKSIS